MTEKKIELIYYAGLKEKRGLSEESIMTPATTLSELYHLLKEQYQFPLEAEQIKVAVNDEFVSMDTQVEEGMAVVFIPPVAGG